MLHIDLWVVQKISGKVEQKMFQTKKWNLCFDLNFYQKKSKKDIKYKCHALCIQAEAVFGGKLFLFLRYFVLLGFVGWVGEHVSQKGSFGCSVNFYDSSSSWESILRSDSLFPRLAVAGCARALALVHGGGLLLGRHPRQERHQRHQTHQTATSGSAGLRGWLWGAIGARGLQEVLH